MIEYNEILKKIDDIISHSITEIRELEFRDLISQLREYNIIGITKNWLYGVYLTERGQGKAFQIARECRRYINELIDKTTRNRITHLLQELNHRDGLKDNFVWIRQSSGLYEHRHEFKPTTIYY